MLFVKSALEDYYYMVGGGVHMGETSQACIEREVYEETGIHACVEQLVVVCENFFKGKGGDSMNIQIFGTKKCNDTKKAERFFKERGIKYQFIDMQAKGMSKGEFNSVAQVNGGLENMINWDGKDKDLLALIKYIADEDKLEKVLENSQVIKTPVVRNGKQSTLGYQPDVWKKWE